MGMHHKTPTLTVFDPRGLSIRSVDYWRAIENLPAESRINRTVHDGAGRAVKQWDPRLWALQVGDPLAPANLASVYLLAGNSLRTDSVDGSTQINLHGLAAEMVVGWDSRETRREVEYDGLLRPVAVFEQGAVEPRRCVERFTYGYPGQGNRDRNQYGQLIRYDDPAGSVLFDLFSIGGECVENTRHFTLDPVTPDWPELIDDRQPLLEPGAGATSRWRFGPLGDVLEQIDARENRQTFSLTVDGRVRESRLQLKDQPAGQTLVSEIRYNAQGQVEGEVAGNGVRTTLAYRPEDGRLMERRAYSERVGLLQHLFYIYDRMGNVLSVEDKALPVRYFANQRIDPINRFSYDSLSQLIEAFGWEAGAPNQGPESVGRTDPAAVSNYRQTYCYDAGGNLLKLTHVGAQNHGRDLKAARYSNRCLPWRNGVPPTEEGIAAAFDAKGNLLALDQGRFLTWDLRNQLQSVSPVERSSGRNDRESYHYDGGGQRVRKIRSLQTNARTVVAEVRYLPGLELRTDSGSGEVLQVITVQAGLNTVRVLHWETEPPSGVNDQYRYTLVDYLNSCTVELAADAQIISQEVFYPYGETAWFAGTDVIGVDYKTIRYSGKERDATGLYYYGFRYYIPWLQRWASTDPAGDVDGLNRFSMVLNNPVTFIDPSGLQHDVVGDYEIDIGRLQRWGLKAKAMTAKVVVFDNKTETFKPSSGFKAVEVGVDVEYTVGKDELKRSLKEYKRVFKHASRMFPDATSGETRMNLELGEVISSEMLELAKSGFQKTRIIEPAPGSAKLQKIVENRFFAILKKEDKLKAPGTRQIYAIAAISTTMHKGAASNDTEAKVEFLVANPASQLKANELKIAADAGVMSKDVSNVRGVGNFLTLKSLNKINKTSKVVKISTRAVNPRSAAIASRAGATWKG
ncbi:RHS repeat-associated core domain protein containing protein [Pseudomonas sp. GM18]|uniref:RHS repeat domain-containing protein n=1 Tax=Pseudomonas sp. GM18 TaxID=1144324 RepID=UPI0002726073|nr:RHS repeat-associated core domain-containing protein [Pseudomonas sp. GM18]EJM19273.1 RHS repeat-associated core domain protein containing protein [Pseudomonas sp. GM18]